MKRLVVSAPAVGATILALVVALAGQALLSIGTNLLPLPRIVQATPEVVVVEAASPSSESEPGGSGQGTSGPPDGGAVPTSGGSDGSASALPTSAPDDPPIVVSATAGYADGGRVVLSLGSADRADGSVTVQRRLAALFHGACGLFGPWQLASANDQLPPGSCAVYRILVKGVVVYELPDIIRFDGTRPTEPVISVTEVGVREHVAGGKLWIAAGAENLRPVVVAADVSDPESGLSGVAFSSGDETVTVNNGPWQAELVPSRGGISVTATNEPGGRSSSTFPVEADGDSPVGGFVEYLSRPAPDGTVAVAFDAGIDVGSGIDASSGVLERRAAVLTSEGCGEYGGWNPAPALDTPGQGRCLQYRYTVRDNVGNETVYTSPVEVLVDDSEAPTTAIVSPSNGATVEGTVSVEATAADSGSGLRSLAIQLNGTSHDWTTLASGSERNLAVSWDTLSVEPGRYLLQSVAEDRSGNVTKSAIVEVTVPADEEAPSVAIASPSYGDTVSGSITVSAQAEDADSGLESVTIQVRGRCGGWTNLATFSSGPFTVTWDTSSVDPGRYKLRAVATDRRGNTAVSEYVAVHVEEEEIEEPPTQPEPKDDGEDGDDESDDDGDEPSDEQPAEEPAEEAPAEDKPTDDAGEAEDADQDEDESQTEADDVEDEESERVEADDDGSDEDD